MTLVAFIAQRIIVPHPTVAPFVLFFAAITVASLVGGRGPGIIATLLSALIGNWYFMEPVYGLTLAGDPLRATILCLVSGSAVALLGGSWRAAMIHANELTPIRYSSWRLQGLSGPEGSLCAHAPRSGPR